MIAARDRSQKLLCVTQNMRYPTRPSPPSGSAREGSVTPREGRALRGAACLPGAFIDAEKSPVAPATTSASTC